MLLKAQSKILKYLDVERIGRRIRCEIGRRISQLGERLNKQHMIYNPLIFGHFHYLAKVSGPMVMRIFDQVFPQAQRYADIGAGTGAYAAAAMRRGKKVVACENSATARRVALEQGVDVRTFDLNLAHPADMGTEPFDLAYCFEVAEHLPPALGDRLAEFTAQQAPLVVWTAAQPPYRGGIGHINEQPRSYWIERFERLGMKYNDEVTGRLSALLTKYCTEAWWLGENVSVFER